MRKSVFTLVAGAVVALGFVFGTAALAGAQQYPPVPVSVTASPNSVAPGGPLTIVAEGFQGEVTFTLFSDPVGLGTATADAEGTAVRNTTLPADTTAGVHTIVADGIGLSSGEATSASTEITVTGPGVQGVTTDRGDLPATGSDRAFPLVRVGAALVVVGGVIVLVARRRKTHGS